MKRNFPTIQSPLEKCLEIPGIGAKVIDFLLVNDRVRIQSLSKSFQKLDCAPSHLANELHLRNHDWQEMADICSRFKRITVLEIWADKLHGEEDEDGTVTYFDTSQLFSVDSLGIELYPWAQKIQKIWLLGCNGLMNHTYGNDPLCPNFEQIKREPEDIHSKIPRKSWNESQGLESFLNTSRFTFDNQTFVEFTHLFPNIIFLDIRIMNSFHWPDFGLMASLTKMKFLIVSGCYDCDLRLENLKKIPFEQLEHLHLRKCVFLEWDNIAHQILLRAKNLKYYQGKSHNRGRLSYERVAEVYEAKYNHDIIICAEGEW